MFRTLLFLFYVNGVKLKAEWEEKKKVYLIYHEGQFIMEMKTDITEFSPHCEFVAVAPSIDPPAVMEEERYFLC